MVKCIARSSTTYVIGGILMYVVEAKYYLHPFICYSNNQNHKWWVLCIARRHWKKISRSQKYFLWWCDIITLVFSAYFGCEVSSWFWSSNTTNGWVCITNKAFCRAGYREMPPTRSVIIRFLGPSNLLHLCSDGPLRIYPASSSQNYCTSLIFIITCLKKHTIIGCPSIKIGFKIQY